MSGETVHPAAPHAGEATSIDPRMGRQGRRFVQRAGGKPRQKPQADNPQPQTNQPPQEDDPHVDVLA